MSHETLPDDDFFALTDAPLSGGGDQASECNAPTPESTVAGIDYVRTYAQLATRRADLDDEIAAVKARMEEIHPAVLEHFQVSGTQRTTVDGRTLYLKRDLYVGRANGITQERACEALREAGLGDFVAERYNANTVSAYMRELDRQGDQLPAVLEGILVVNETFRILVRKA